MDPIEKARGRALSWATKADLRRMQADYLATLDCLEALRGPRWREYFEADALIPVEDELCVVRIDAHAEAWDKFTKAVCGGK